jgi:aminoglycoside phosphotransferase (APT) family kinase protein
MDLDACTAALVRMGLTQPGEHVTIAPLPGGVSSEIARADLESGVVCIKRALPRLKVKAHWEAPVERNRYEVEWIRIVNAIAPNAVPRILGDDPEGGMFAMEFLDGTTYPVWKDQLRDGNISTVTARQVGGVLAAVHQHTAGAADTAARFETDHIFFPIRLEPYLLATAVRHPDCAASLEALVRLTRTTRKALVHGDVSPKNILVGPRGPVFLDAECAWYGDPAFDLAFCLNHLLLKCMWRPQWEARYLDCYTALSETYLAGVTWEPPADIEQRSSHLLAGLLLGRVDGKSPVEYLTNEEDRDRVRTVARKLLHHPVDTLLQVRTAWESR